MKLIWFTFAISVLVLGVLNSLTGIIPSLGLIVVLLHVIVVSIILMSYKSKLKVVFLTGYLVRVVLLFWDLFARNIFILPNSGTDSEMFYDASLIIARDLTMLNNTRGRMYSNIMGILFRLIGDQRIVGQYINVLFGLSILFVIYKILNLLDINKKTQDGVLIIASFFPNSIIMSVVFLREIIPTFFVAVSLMEYIKWIKSSRIKEAALALFYISVASIFHSGVIGIILGYFFGFLFYNTSNNKLRFSLKTVINFVLSIFLIIVSFIYFEDLIFGKFSAVEDISDIYVTTNRRMGGSAYLKSLTINNPLQFLVFSPIRAFYFLTSPLPIYWRGFMDAFTFLTDSMLYLLSIIYYIKNKNKLGDRRSIVIIIIWMLLGSSLVFGIGVSNAGTAVRHRQKLVPIFLALLAIIMDCKKKTNNIGNNKSRSEDIE